MNLFVRRRTRRTLHNLTLKVFAQNEYDCFIVKQVDDRWMIDDWLMIDGLIGPSWVEGFWKAARKKTVQRRVRLIERCDAKWARRRRNSTPLRKRDLAKSMWTQEHLLLPTSKWSSSPDWLVKSHIQVILKAWNVDSNISGIGTQGAGVSSAPPGGEKLNVLNLNLRLKSVCRPVHILLATQRAQMVFVTLNCSSVPDVDRFDKQHLACSSCKKRLLVASFHQVVSVDPVCIIWISKETPNTKH